MTARMQRRKFLGMTAGAGAGAALLPAWMAGCFSTKASRGPDWGPPSGGGDSAVGMLRAAWNEARTAGRPLLVLTIPAADEQKSLHGEAWGELLNHGPVEGLANLSLCDVACAEAADVELALPGFDGLPKDEPLAILVETDSPRATAIELELERIVYDWGQENPDYEIEVTDRMSKMTRALGAAIAGDRDTIERRAKQCAERLGLPLDSPVADPFSVAGRPAIDEARRAPAMVRLFAERDSAQRESALALLAAVAVERIVNYAPRGARWASSTGCGVDVEGCEGEGLAVACGMGFTPEVSSRFLWFYEEA